MFDRRWTSSAVLSTRCSTTSMVRRYRPVPTPAEKGPARSAGCGVWLERQLPEPAKDVHLTVQNNQLVIEGERKAPERFDKNAFTQLAYGKFHTALTLPTGLDV